VFIIFFIKNINNNISQVCAAVTENGSSCEWKDNKCVLPNSSRNERLPPPSKKTGLIVGLVVGVVVLILVIAVAVVVIVIIMVQRRKQKKKLLEGKKHNEEEEKQMFEMSERKSGVKLMDEGGDGETVASFDDIFDNEREDGNKIVKLLDEENDVF
jgi:flagellar biosynthesis/type III secretory pathway M-ring protein FliF/YscJ